MAELKIKNGQEKYYDLNAKSDVIRYVLNPQKAPRYYDGYNIETDDPAEEMMSITRMYNKEKGVQLWHFIVSFDRSEVSDPCHAYVIADDLARYFSKSFQIIYAIHEDTDHLHIHLVNNSISFVDGHRYYCSRGEYHQLYQYFKNVLRSYGIRCLAYVPSCVHSENFE